MIHRTGSRADHKTTAINGVETTPLASINATGKWSVSSNGLKKEDSETDSLPKTDLVTKEADAEPDADLQEEEIDTSLEAANGVNTAHILERSKYVPLRLTLQERKKLRLLEAALNVSEYTDKIDIYHSTSKMKRIRTMIIEVCSILSGLVVAADYNVGQKLFTDRNFQDNESFYQDVFEIGRRWKILNPSQGRNWYGKLMYMLMDSVIPEIQSTLPLKLVTPIKTVHSFLASRDALEMLNHALVPIATKEIQPQGKSRNAINKEIKEKENAIKILSRRFSRNGKVSVEELEQCLYSLGDQSAYIRFNRDSCSQMHDHLTQFFDPKHAESPERDLSIAYGRKGARLSHSHATHYQYVSQTLNLWREIQDEMFKLWWSADKDMLSEKSYYRLANTGQGLNRIQQCPTVSREMHGIVHRAQKRVGSWIGSSVIHLGDQNVPNALMFIDKYNQVAKILNPILIVLNQLDKINSDPNLSAYIQKTFGGVEACKGTILLDFFRYGFDGSGAEDNFSAGSCIDGRLTSAWNWCNSLGKKPYYPIFLLGGFTTFDEFA